ncbi:MAG: polysaccharide deacetylase family protein [Polyangiaceae bacterium]
MATRLCAVSVDLDEIPNYFQIHGLKPSKKAETAVYDIAVSRLSDFARAEKLPMTFFAVGSDLARRESAEALAKLHRDGHEIGNHTLDHRYDLTRLARDEIEAQIRGGADAIEKATGTRPTGFRAPGYVITDEVFSVLRDLDVAYDSSVFPCPPYNFLKAAAILKIAIQGKTSRSIVDTPKMLLAPTTPYRIGTPYWKRGNGMLELPIQVTRGLRLPFIGTTVTLAGPSRAKQLAKMCVGDPLVNLELHGIDVLDTDDDLHALRPHQPDVRVTRETKIESLAAVVDVFREAGYSFVTMAEAAKEF